MLVKTKTEKDLLQALEPFARLANAVRPSLTPEPDRYMMFTGGRVDATTITGRDLLRAADVYQEHYPDAFDVVNADHNVPTL